MGSLDQTQTRTKILLTSFSAMVAETATFPVDLVKTRLQLHGESLSSTRPANAVRMTGEILRQQGPLGLYQGLSPAIIRHLFYTPIRIVGYENLRNFCVNDGDGAVAASISLPGKALIGGISGVIAQKNKNSMILSSAVSPTIEFGFIFLNLLNQIDATEVEKYKEESNAQLWHLLTLLEMG